ncbi:unnamed protein product [Cunninghamella echinulata]
MVKTSYFTLLLLSYIALAQCAPVVADNTNKNTITTANQAAPVPNDQPTVPPKDGQPTTPGDQQPAQPGEQQPQQPTQPTTPGDQQPTQPTQPTQPSQPDEQQPQQPTTPGDQQSGEQQPAPGGTGDSSPVSPKKGKEIIECLIQGFDVSAVTSADKFLC